jgi:hypothetical protein
MELEERASLYGKIPGKRRVAICCFAGVIVMVRSQAVKRFALVFWMAALLAVGIVPGVAGSVYAQHHREE